MIAESIEQAANTCAIGPAVSFLVQISVTDGEEIALKTTNARLGVIGGISILGSTGVVQPYSTAAWRASVHLANRLWPQPTTYPTSCSRPAPRVKYSLVSTLTYLKWPTSKPVFLAVRPSSGA